MEPLSLSARTQGILHQNMYPNISSSRSRSYAQYSDLCISSPSFLKLRTFVINELTSPQNLLAILESRFHGEGGRHAISAKMICHNCYCSNYLVVDICKGSSVLHITVLELLLLSANFCTIPSDRGP